MSRSPVVLALSLALLLSFAASTHANGVGASNKKKRSPPPPPPGAPPQVSVFFPSTGRYLPVRVELCVLCCVCGHRHCRCHSNTAIAAADTHNTHAHTQTTTTKKQVSCGAGSAGYTCYRLWVTLLPSYAIEFDPFGAPNRTLAETASAGFVRDVVSGGEVGLWSTTVTNVGSTATEDGASQILSLVLELGPGRDDTVVVTGSSNTDADGNLLDEDRPVVGTLLFVLCVCGCVCTVWLCV